MGSYSPEPINRDQDLASFVGCLPRACLVSRVCPCSKELPKATMSLHSYIIYE